MAHKIWKFAAQSLTLLAIGVSMSACKVEDELTVALLEQRSGREANIDLPPVPPLPLLDIPREYPDGTLSAMGLTLKRDENMAKKVAVSGIVVDKYVCETPEDTRGRRGAAAPASPCLYPHFFLADSPTSTRRILITGYDSSYESQLMENTRYTVRGLYTVQATGFQASEWGIIIPDAIEGSGIQQPAPR